MSELNCLIHFEGAQVFRKKVSTPAAPPLSEIEQFRVSQDVYGTFNTLLNWLKKPITAENRNWLFSELMQTYPSPTADLNNELHTLMGLYLLGTDAPEAALKEFKKVEFEFLRDHAAVDFLKCLDRNNLRTGMHKTIRLFAESKSDVEIAIVDYAKSDFSNQSIEDAISAKCFSIPAAQQLQEFIAARKIAVEKNEILLISNMHPAENSHENFDSWLQIKGLSDALTGLRIPHKLIPQNHVPVSATNPKISIISGNLTRESFEVGENLKLLFVGVRILDEKVLNARNLSTLQKAAPVIALDTATSQLLSFYEVPNFIMSSFTSHVSIKVSKKPNGTAWFDIDQWAGVQISNYKSKTSINPDDYQKLNSKSIIKLLAEVLGHQTIRTSSLALATLAASKGRVVEYKARAKYRAASNWPLNLESEKLKQTRWLKLLKQNVSTANFQSLVTEEFATEIESTRSEFYAESILPPSSIQTTNIELLRTQRISLKQTEESSRHLHIAFGFDQNLIPYFEPVLKQLSEYGSFTADIYLLARGFGFNDIKAMVQRHPKFNLHFFNFDDIDYGDKINTLEHITVSTMDRLLLPELLPEVNQLVYLDTDLAVQADIWEIGGLNLGDHAIAARLITTDVWGSGWKTFQKAAGRIDSAHAAEIRQTLLRKHRLLQTKFINAGVLVLNLALMRAENFTVTYLGLIEQARLNDQDVLSIYAQGRVIELGTEWNYTPAQVEILDPKIVHWAGPKKPWKPDFVWHQNIFNKYFEN
ncbi:MAG: hypothetical protein RL038_1241 [Actinomycetota bacterium]